MTTETIRTSGHEITANLDDRTITCLLVPYGEVGQTNAGKFKVMAGSIAIPADPSVVSLNLDHDRYSPVGRATRLWEESAGIMATLSIANTPAGDAALADARNPQGTRRAVSAEYRCDIDYTAGDEAGIASNGVLAAAALCARGAFPSALVLASSTETVEHRENEYTDEDGTIWRRVTDVTTTTEYDPESGASKTTETIVTEATSEEKEGTEVSESTAEVQAATVQITPAGTTKPRVTGAEIVASIATLRRNPLDQASIEVLAALSDIKLTGSGALPATGVLQPNWLGLLDLGERFQREYLPLLKLGNNITAAGKKAFKFHRGTSANPTWGDGTWAGNKSEINSGGGHTATIESSLLRYARGADIGREFFDLPGGTEVIEAYLRELDIDYNQWSDEEARKAIVTAAGTPVAPQTYPGVDGHDYAGAMGQLIQGILLVKRRKADGRKDTPTFAIANDKAYEELLYTPKDLVPEFVTFDVNSDGTGTADGKVHVVAGDTGIEDTSSVIVGADYAIEFDELAGGVHVEALDLAKGGIDKAVHGYLQKFVARPEAIVHIGTADVTP